MRLRAPASSMLTSNEPARPVIRHMVNRPAREVKSSQDESGGRDYNPYSPLEAIPILPQSGNRGRGRGLPRKGSRPGGGARPKETVGRAQQDGTPAVGLTQVQPTGHTSAATSDSPLTVSESDTSTAYDSWYEEGDDEARHPTKKRVTGTKDGGMEWTESIPVPTPTSSTPRPGPSKQQQQAAGKGQQGDQRRPGGSGNQNRAASQTVLVPNPKGELSVYKDNNRNDGQSGEASTDSYADKARKEPWSKPKNKKRKNMKPHSRKIPPLEAVKKDTFKDIYVQELNYARCACKEDLEAIVFEYCKDRGVTAYDLNTIPVKGTRVKAGCKVTVLEADYEALLNDDFWPEGAAVRPWRPKPKSDDESDDPPEKANK